MGDVVHFYRPPTKATLIDHLERDHRHAVTVKLDPKRWTKRELESAHFMIHLGRGEASHHPRLVRDKA